MLDFEKQEGYLKTKKFNESVNPFQENLKTDKNIHFLVGYQTWDNSLFRLSPRFPGKHILFLSFHFLSFILPLSAGGQYAYVRKDFPVTINSKTLQSPWAGGLNNPQFSVIDLDNDGKEDLFIFDRMGNKVLTFLNTGTPGNADYVHAPQYQKLFPALQSWALLLDFNCDSVPDIFTSLNYGIAVYKGKKDGNNNLSFTLFKQELQYNSSSPTKMQIASIDLPAIADVSGDGDLDILTFPSGGGLSLEYYENQTKELSGNCDSLFFELKDMCWGKFAQSTLYKSVLLNISCKGNHVGSNHVRHGTNTILALDMNGDNVQDLVYGDFNFNNLNLLMNGGTASDALIISQDTAFPKNSVAAVLDRLPAAFHLDVDNDGLKDLLVAPNSTNFSMNYQNVWWYKNTGSASNTVFTFQYDTFLVADMIDVGEGANPVFFDYNADGLQDIIIGNYFTKTTPANMFSGLALYENTGTSQNPSFKWITSDFAGLSGFADLRGIFPAFGDLDGDGDMDMMVGDGYASDDGSIHYFENTAGTGNIANFVLKQAQYKGIDVGQFSTPQLVDVNRDGKLDLLIGERNGNLNYYENTGTTSVPDFTLKSASFGGVDVKRYGFITGFSTPFLTTLDSTNTYYLLVGSESGYIYYYKDIDGNLTGNFTLVDSMYGNINEGWRSSIHGADINGDGKKELVIGNNRGGVTIFSPDTMTNTTTLHPLPADEWVKIYPNPAGEKVIINMEDLIFSKGRDWQFIMYDVLGKELYRQTLNTKHAILNTHLLPGIYFCKISLGNRFIVKKLIIQ